MRIPIKASMLAVLVGMSAIAPVHAQQYVTTIFGHEVYVVGEFGDHVLKVDGADALSDGRVILREIGLAGDVPYILGDVGTGGNICASVPFVVSFAAPAPAVDVFPEDCMGPPHEVGDGEIRFEIPGDAVTAARAWVWRPADGFREVEAVVQNTGSGWDAFRTRAISAPSDLMQYTDLVEALQRLTGDDFELFARLVYGPPSATYEGTTFIGSNCISHDCPAGGTLVIADLSTQELFVAWESPSDGGGQVRPAEGSWPSGFQQVLDEWQAQW